MEIHHSKHHAGYTVKFNAALESASLDSSDLTGIMALMDMNNAALRNNGGGYYNHCLFWENLSPQPTEMSADLASCIVRCFGSVDNMKEAFNKAAATRFGSGWAWLCRKDDGSLEVCSTANQDNPLMPDVGCGGRPILALDVWEHAYYLHYQNRRPDYINAFWSIVNWDVVSKRWAG
jgi:Fe-Mn family superoxide dismutase